MMVKSRNLDFATIKEHARELRKNMTESEEILWDKLRNRKLSGYKFLRQHQIIYKGDLKRRIILLQISTATKRSWL